MNCLLVIPHFRHLEQLGDFLPTLVDHLATDISILVSDDGSGSQTATALGQLIAAQRSRTGISLSRIPPPLIAPQNHGKGHAVYAGWRTATSQKWLAFVDADGAVSVGEINRAWNYLREAEPAPDVLIASRIAALGRTVERSHYRHLSGRVFATIASLVSGLTVYDSQCGLKFIRRAAFEKIAAFAKAERFAFDIELLMLAAASGCRIEEFPIDWRHMPGGKVSVVRDSIPMLLELLRARRSVAAYQRQPR
ncbi:MAG: glycosyltransferase [Chthoniobacterales bacterium]